MSTGRPRGARRSWKRAAQAALLLVVSVLAALLIGEVVVFVLYGDKMVLAPRYVTDAWYGDFHIRGNVPGSHYWHRSAEGKWEYIVNSRGFRDVREFDYEKPRGVTRILVLGDSFTMGYQVQQDETYASILERYLNKNGVPAEVINAGMSGNSTAEELVFLEEEGLKYDPDFVVLGFCANDPLDSVRADLYRLEGDDLVLNKKVYLPAIRIRNFLNSFGPYRFLSERSYLHNYLNQAATLFFKRREVERNVASLESRQAARSGTEPALDDYGEALSLALVKRMYSVVRDHGARFIILDIAVPTLEPAFPQGEDVDPEDMADAYVDAGALLEEYQGLTALRCRGGAGHWTAFSHLVAGVAIGKTILEALESEQSS